MNHYNDTTTNHWRCKCGIYYVFYVICWKKIENLVCLLLPASLHCCLSWGWGYWNRKKRWEKWKMYVWLSLEMSVLHQQQLRVLWHCPICLSDWNQQPLNKGTAEHGLSISAGICCLEPFIKIITQLCISLQPLSLSHPSVRVHHRWSRVKLRRVQSRTWRSFTQYVTCLLCLYPKSTSEILCSFFLDLSLSLD